MPVLTSRRAASILTVKAVCSFSSSKALGLTIRGKIQSIKALSGHGQSGPAPALSTAIKLMISGVGKLGGARYIPSVSPVFDH
jgi:hypothetical protein